MYTRRRSSWKRKTQRRPWLLIIVLLLIGVPIGLELLTRLVVQLAGLTDELTADRSGEAEIVEAYKLGFLNPDGQPYDELPNQGELLAVRDPLMGYHLRPDQKNSFWTINSQGFRDEEPVAIEKPPGEVRIFVLGGSTAFGQLNSNNQATFASQLEKLLNERVTGQQNNPDRYQPATLPYRADQVEQALALPPRISEQPYRVVNAAVPGYASGNELSLLVQHVAEYNPDMLIVLNSYSDLMLPSSHDGVDIPGLDALIEGEEESIGSEITASVQNWFNRLYSVRVYQHYILQSQEKPPEQLIPLNMLTVNPGHPIDKTLATDDAELNRRVSRYRSHMLQIVQWSSATRKRLFVGLQPEITGRSPDAMTPEEKAILAKLGNTYTERVQLGYTKLAEVADQTVKSSANARLLNLYKLYETYEGQAFQNPTSLTDEANGVLAKRFFDAIAAELALQPKPFGAIE
ncbi:MAG: SGNH/GDSL hydrolase family protein [Cyanobacteria bacterium CRU_2_1]|nr:SGNH/GDSL hydrolase family protein [Cyanobacteria bacterium CRU_2_1]